MKRLIFSLFFLLTACSGGGGSDDEIDNPGVDVGGDSGGDGGNRVWTVAEILAEPETGGAGGAPLCGGEGGFKRCICAEQVPFYVRYRPAVEECGGNAAAILSDRLSDVFSIVVRDTQNRDRWPAPGSGFGGCSAELAGGDSPPARCSAFKVQQRFMIGGGIAEMHCFGASGYSEIFSDAARMTVKLSDDPFSNDDEIERYCLVSGSEPLN